MKSFITAIIVFIVMVAGIITHVVYANSVTDRLLEAVSRESIATASGAEQAEQYWTKHKLMIHLGINTSYTDRINSEFATLRSAIENRDSEKAAESAALIKLYISELERVNKLSLENIL